MAIRRGGPPAVPFVHRPFTPEEERIRTESAAIPDERIDALRAEDPGLSWVGAIFRLTPEADGEARR
jgi:hypothetical protein